MNNPKDAARNDFFNLPQWARYTTPPEKAVETFNLAYEYGFKDGMKKDRYWEDGLAQGIKQVRENLGIYDGAEILVSDPGYEKLVEVLEKAHNHAARGKGKERHANNLPFERQRMLSITRELNSPRGLAYQAIKKISEGLDLPTHNQTLGELLGAINYIAGMIIFLQEIEDAKPVPPATDSYSQLAEDFKDVSFAAAPDGREEQAEVTPLLTFAAKITPEEIEHIKRIFGMNLPGSK